MSIILFLPGLLQLKESGALDLMIKNYTESLPSSGELTGDTMSLGSSQIGIIFILFSFVPIASLLSLALECLAHYLKSKCYLY